MSTAPPIMDPHWMPPEPPRSGCGRPLFLGCGCGCFLLVLLCCGGFVGVAWWFQRSVTVEPAAIQTVVNEIAQIDLPAALKPKAAIRLKAPFGEKPLLLIGAMYEDPESKSVLMLGTGVFLTDDVAKAMQEALQKETPDDQRQPLLNSRTEQKEIKIMGQPTSITFTTGKDSGSKQSRLEVRGVFAGKSGSALFIFAGSAEQYPAAKIQAILESMH